MRRDGLLKRSLLSLSIGVALAGCTTSPENAGRQTNQSAATQTSQYASTNLNLARGEFGRGNYGNAIEILERELAQKPASVAALNGLGACYDQLGRYDVAQRYYFRALDLAPESATTLSNIGYSYLQQGRHREAVAVLELAMQRDAASAIVANNLTLARTGLAGEGAGVAISNGDGREGTASPVVSDAQIESLLTSLGGLSDGDDGAQTISDTARGSDNVQTISIPVSEVTSPAEPVRASVVLTEVAPVPATVTAGPAGSQYAGAAPIARQASLALPVERPLVSIEEPAPLVASNAGTAQPQAAPVSSGQAPELTLAPEPAPLPEPPAALTEPAAGAVTLSEPAPVQANQPVNPANLVPAVNDEPAPTAVVTSQLAVITDVIAPVPAQQAPEPADPATSSIDVQTPQLTLTIVETPELDPAVVSDVAPGQTLANLTEPLNLVVENGNGVRGIARATSSFLRGDALAIVGISDADNFDYAQTVIYHRPELAGYAREIAASLNLNCDFQAVTALANDADVRVVLGHDFARQADVDNGWLSFDNTPDTEYLTSTIRLEVANGNGVAGMAARVRSYLQARGGSVARITNANNFDYVRTILYHRPGMQIAAKSLVEELPVSGVRLVEDDSLPWNIDARLIVGSDLIPIETLVSN